MLAARDRAAGSAARAALLRRDRGPAGDPGSAGRLSPHRQPVAGPSVAAAVSAHAGHSSAAARAVDARRAAEAGRARTVGRRRRHTLPAPRRETPGSALTRCRRSRRDHPKAPAARRCTLAPMIPHVGGPASPRAPLVGSGWRRCLVAGCGTISRTAAGADRRPTSRGSPASIVQRGIR